jgi:hypothetical protein
MAAVGNPKQERSTAMGNDHALVRQVRLNCTISDARFAGIYSVCGLAMRLRDLYKWEHSLPPYEEHEASRVLEWIGCKESDWEALQDTAFQDLVIDGKRIEPFDTAGVNRLLAPYNLFYGAGYAQGLKPSFFLAEIERQAVVGGHPVVFLGSEKARDLLTLPSLTQDDTIVVRKAAIDLYVWDQMLYMNRSGRPFFRFGLEAVGLSGEDAGALRRCLPEVAAAQLDTFLYHEAGEMDDTCFDSAAWRELIAALPHSPAEFLVRAVKDILADTDPGGALPQMVRTRTKAALGFYAAFLDGLRKHLFPEIRAGIAGFMQDENWSDIENMTRAVHQKAAEMARTIAALYREGQRDHDHTWVAEELNRRYIHPLTA